MSSAQPPADDNPCADSLLARFFETGLKAVFTHVSQMFSASLVVAAGTYASRRTDSLQVVGVIDMQVAGGLLVGIGILLLVLNLFQGLYHLHKLRHPWVLQLLLVVVYVFLSCRAAQLFVLFRNAA